MSNIDSAPDPSRRDFLGASLLAAGAAVLPRVLVAAEKGAQVGPGHPLDPLSESELAAAVEILRTEYKLGDSWRFVSAVLVEPEKKVARSWRPGEPMARQAFVVLLDTAQQAGFEAVVNLPGKKVARFEKLPRGVQPAVMLDEFGECEEAVKRSPLFREALQKRGVENVDLVMVEPWSAGNYGTEVAEDKGRRLLRALCFVRSERTDNGFARPLDGVVAVVDLHKMEVLRVEDYGVTPLPPEAGNWARQYITAYREEAKPLEISQPKGPSFTCEGWQVRWQNWSLRIGYTPREGIVLHQVRYQDGGEERLILDRASICEMVVPYGDPGEQYYRKNAFDIGEYGIGTLANSLSLGCDCLGTVKYFDTPMVDSRGKIVSIKNAICLHEEDAGLLWKHTDWRTNQTDSRRARRLSLSFIATVGNYEYAFYWHLYQDASLHCEIKLTGIMNTTALPEGGKPEFGVEVATRLQAPFHQHIFAARLDVSLDGERNTVQEVNTVGLPTGPKNPHGNAFRAEVTDLASEKQAQRSVNSATGRFWRVVNSQRKNRLGQPAGYRLVPGENSPVFAQPDARILRRAGFAKNNLWVTPFSADERFPAGNYPNQNPGGDGLPKWTAADRPVSNSDTILWYVFSHNHVPRVEDWPVMPAASIGFRLVPDGFFERNPALDLPPAV